MSELLVREALYFCMCESELAQASSSLRVMDRHSKAIIHRVGEVLLESAPGSQNRMALERCRELAERAMEVWNMRLGDQFHREIVSIARAQLADMHIKRQGPDVRQPRRIAAGLGFC